MHPYFFLDPEAPANICTLIERHETAAVQKITTDWGSDHVLNCVDVIPVWSTILTEEQQPYWWLIGLYRLDLNGRDHEHQFLAIGTGLWLFDPTAAQFTDDRTVQVSLSNYLVKVEHFVAATPFPEWRRQRIERT